MRDGEKEAWLEPTRKGIMASGGRMIPGATKPRGHNGQLGRQNAEPMLQLV